MKGKDKYEIICFDSKTGKRIEPKNYKLSREEARHFALLIKDEIAPFIKENWSEYVEFLEERAKTEPSAAKELADIKSSKRTKPQ